MPNFGLKCFLGSFIFSLLAVFAVTKGYFLLTEDKLPINSAFTENETVHNIELFSQNDETDKIFEKFKKISSPSQVQLPLTEELKEDNLQEIDDGEYDDISDTLAFDGEQTGDIIYDPDSEDVLLEPENEESDKNAKFIASETITEDEKKVELVESNSDESDDDDLYIADAEDAPQFIIPLKHTFGVSTIGGTSVSSETENAPTALASQEFKAQAQVETDKFSDPWDTAAVGNQYITKNKIATISQEHKAELAAIDKEKNSEAKSENETKIAYKMMKNILIPIPEEIANDENLTPQLSYSPKNKKINADLKNKQIAAEKLKKEQEEAEQRKENITEEQTKSLSDSITDWFAAAKTKEKVNIVKEEPRKIETKETTNDYNNEEEKKEESTFSKLLGLKKKKGTKNILPSELKLSFQPNRAEISGQTLEWLRAFSQNAVKDDEVMVEIRIDGSGSYELQQKRLNLLYTIFANNGVNYEKINIIFTARDPNSFIIRNVKYALENNTQKTESKKVGPWY